MVNWFRVEREKTEEASKITKDAKQDASRAITTARLELDRALRELAKAKAQAK